MDIENYSELKEIVSYEINKNSEYYKKYKVTKVEEYFKLIFEHKKDKEIQDVYYRGQGNCDWDIDASIFRKKTLKNEDDFLNNVKARRPNDFKNCKNHLDELTIMQHYEVPTRLLDITANPLVALYFACEDFKKKEDGVVYLFEEDKRTDQDYINIVSSFAFFENSKPIDQFIDYLKNQNYYYNKDKIMAALNKKRLLIKPKKNNERIIAQQGYFFLLSNNSGLEGNEYLNKRNFFIESSKIILIKGHCKEDILKELEIIGIKKSTIYPELNNHVDELIEKYRDKEVKLLKRKESFGKNNNLEERESLKNKNVKVFIDSLEKSFQEEIQDIILNEDWIERSQHISQMKLRIKKYYKNNPKKYETLEKLENLIKIILK